MDRAARRPGMHAPARDRYAALALTVVVNAVAGVLLLRVASLAPSIGGEPESVMTVVWVERARPAPTRPALAPATRARRTRPAAARAVAAAPAADPTVEAPVVQPDLQPGAAPPQLAERNGLESGAFRHRGVFAPRVADPFAKTRDGIFRMQDASIGGRLQRMTQRSICRELRAQLHSGANADMDAILRTMAERGCG